MRRFLNTVKRAMQTHQSDLHCIWTSKVKKYMYLIYSIHIPRIQIFICLVAQTTVSEIWDHFKKCTQRPDLFISQVKSTPCTQDITYEGRLRVTRLFYKSSHPNYPKWPCHVTVPCLMSKVTHVHT